MSDEKSRPLKEHIFVSPFKDLDLTPKEITIIEKNILGKTKRMVVTPAAFLKLVKNEHKRWREVVHYPDDYPINETPYTMSDAEFKQMLSEICENLSKQALYNTKSAVGISAVVKNPQDPLKKGTYVSLYASMAVGISYNPDYSYTVETTGVGETFDAGIIGGYSRYYQSAPTRNGDPRAPIFFRKNKLAPMITRDEHDGSWQIALKINSVEAVNTIEPIKDSDYRLFNRPISIGSFQL